MNADIIFLCDTRLVNSNGVNGAGRLKSALYTAKGKKYDLYCNSNSNSRGVAILIATDLNIKIQNTIADLEENFLFAKFNFKGKNWLIGSIYGPNTTCRDFYRRLSNVLARDGTDNVVIGGDWNTTWDRSPPGNNLDVFRMANNPNPKNAELLERLCITNNLTDPFRILNPFKKEFTYSPFGNKQTNRSRLDFFIISNNLLTTLGTCTITPCCLSNLFNHKAISLSFADHPNLNRPKIKSLKNSFLTDPLHKWVSVQQLNLGAITCITYLLNI